MHALHGFIQLPDDALARSSALRHAVPAIAQARVGGFTDQRNRLRAARIQHRNQVADALAVAIALVSAVAVTVTAHNSRPYKKLLATSFWLLAFGFWLLAFGLWPL